jgi:hypothetical protein
VPRPRNALIREMPPYVNIARSDISHCPTPNPKADKSTGSPDWERIATSAADNSGALRQWGLQAHQDLVKSPPRSLPRRGGRVVECGGLENRCRFAPTQGSNPCLSAITYKSLNYNGLGAAYHTRLPHTLATHRSASRSSLRDLKNYAELLIILYTQKRPTKPHEGYPVFLGHTSSNHLILLC